MENLRVLVFWCLVAIVGVGFPALAFSYERDTHKGISGATTKAYESLRGQAFTAEEERVLVQGSFDEDDGTRPLNHFFDPINNRGLSVFLSSWPMSRLWAQDTEAQANYCDWGLCSKRVGYDDKYFSSPTDYSWDRAIYEFVHGDKNRGLRTLGHILHLLQDSSVPAHVRNDQHLNHQGVGDPDPYEKFSGRFGANDVAVPSKIEPIPSYQSLDEYILAMALYANNGFVSKDTVFEKYDLPKLVDLDIKGDGFAYDRRDGHRVIFFKEILNQKSNAKKQILSLDNAVNDPHSLVLNDYWTYLSREAVRNGVGIIDLFFREVENEKRTGALKKKNTSEAERRAKQLAQKGFGIVKKLYGSSLTAEDVAELAGDAPAAVVVAIAPEEARPPRSSVPLVVSPVRPAAVKVQDVRKEEVTEPIESSEEESDSPSSSSAAATSTSSGVPNPFPVPPGGGGGIPQRSASSTLGQSATQAIPGVPIISVPTEGSFTNAANVQIGGSAGAGHLVTVSYQAAGATTTATTTADNAGAWSISIAPTEGTVLIYAVATSGGANSGEVSRSFTVDRTAPDISGVSILECQYLLRASDCSAVGSAHFRLASTSADMSYFSAIVDDVVVATSSSADIAATIATGAHQLAIAAYDAAGNGATSTAVAVEGIASPLVVNEVAWSGTPADPGAQWVELYNRSTQDVSLAHVTLSFGSSEPTKLSGTIPAEAYYLIERSEEDISVASDLLEPSLSLATPVAISLSYAPGGQATTSLDSTPIDSACGGAWCDGASGATPSSMERTQVNVAGALSTNWNSNDGIWRNGTDANGTAIHGSPKAQNSQSLHSIGFFCEPETSTFAEGGYYRFGDGEQGRCTYQSPNFGGNRYGVIFVGTVGSSTALSFHFLGNATEKFELEPAFTDSAEGMDLFATVFVPRFTSFNDDVTAFTDFFQTGTPPPTLNYGIIRFKWGTAP